LVFVPGSSWRLKRNAHHQPLRCGIELRSSKAQAHHVQNVVRGGLLAPGLGVGIGLVLELGIAW